MNLNEKKLLVDFVKSQYAESTALFVINVQGLPVNGSKILRSKIRNSGGLIKVVKTRLVRRALDDLGLAGKVSGLQDMVTGQIAMIFAKQDPVNVAKALMEFAKTSARPNIIVGGLYQEGLMSTARIDALSKLPPYEVLVQMCASALAAPMTGVARSINGIVEGLARAIKAVSEQTA